LAVPDVHHGRLPGISWPSSRRYSPLPVISSSMVRPLARNDSFRHSGPPRTSEALGNAEASGPSDASGKAAASATSSAGLAS
jgi:hypothetical protein